VGAPKNGYAFLAPKKLRNIKEVWNPISVETHYIKGSFVGFQHGVFRIRAIVWISLGVSQTIEKTVNAYKGESFFWINQNKFTKEKFELAGMNNFCPFLYQILWSTRFRIISKSGEHHRKETFQEEYEEFILKYGFLKKFKGWIGLKPRIDINLFFALGLSPRLIPNNKDKIDF